MAGSSDCWSASRPSVLNRRWKLRPRPSHPDQRPRREAADHASLDSVAGTAGEIIPAIVVMRSPVPVEIAEIETAATVRGAATAVADRSAAKDGARVALATGLLNEESAKGRAAASVMLHEAENANLPDPKAALTRDRDRIRYALKGVRMRASFATISPIALRKAPRESRLMETLHHPASVPSVESAEADGDAAVAAVVVAGAKVGAARVPVSRSKAECQRARAASGLRPKARFRAICSALIQGAARKSHRKETADINNATPSPDASPNLVRRNRQACRKHRRTPNRPTSLSSTPNRSQQLTSNPLRLP